MNKIITIIDKEWNEVFKNGMVLGTIIALPLLLTALPLIILYAMGGSSGDLAASSTSGMPSQYAALCGSNLGGLACTQVMLVSQFLIMFLLMPLAIPAAIAAYSIVGEKTTRCLEPLLATPITTAELIVGKAAAAVIPAVIATWGCFGIFAVGVRLLVSDPEVYGRILAPHWLLAIVVLGPLLAVAAVCVSIIVSSRVSDPRAAEQLSMLVMIPLLGIFFGQMAGLFLFNASLVWIMTIVLILIDAGLVYLGVGLFQRETILTRWK